MALFEIKCPMCKGSIWIDPSSGKVVDHKAAEHQKANFDTFLENRKKATDQWEDKFNKAKQEQEKRKSEIEKKFKEAKEHPEQLDGEYQSPFQWD